MGRTKSGGLRFCADRAGRRDLGPGSKVFSAQKERIKPFGLTLSFHAEDGTWTHTSAMPTRSLVLLVCQFRHFRLPHQFMQLWIIFIRFISLTQDIVYQRHLHLSTLFLNFFRQKFFVWFWHFFNYINTDKFIYHKNVYILFYKNMIL